MVAMSRTQPLWLLMICAALSLVARSDSTCAQVVDDDKGWVRLDEADTSHADPKTDKIEFNVKDKEVYSKIRIRNHGPTVRFTEVDILYGDNTIQKIEMDRTVEGDQGTGPIDLKGK